MLDNTYKGTRTSVISLTAIHREWLQKAKLFLHHDGNQKGARKVRRPTFYTVAFLKTFEREEEKEKKKKERKRTPD